MAADYDFKEIEQRWSQKWISDNAWRAPRLPDPATKRYALTMFPYPSGVMHMGHVEVFSMASGRLERVRSPRLPNIPVGLFTHGGSVGHLDAVDCRRKLVMISSAVSQGRGYDVTRRFLEPGGDRWRLRGSLTTRSSIRPQHIARFEEFSAAPFSSC